MKAIIAIAALLVAGACDQAGGYYPPPVFGGGNYAPQGGIIFPDAGAAMSGRPSRHVYVPDPYPLGYYGSQTIRTPSGRMVNCTTTGTFTNCY